MNKIRQWLQRRWKFNVDQGALLFAYRSIPEMVVQDLIDKFYFVGGVPNDPIAQARHIGHQEVVLAIVTNIDIAIRPDQYKVEVHYAPQMDARVIQPTG